MRNPQRRRLTALALTAIGGIVLAGCTTSGGSAGSTGSGSVKGSTVTIYGPDTGSEATQLEASWSDWAKKEGITINYTGDKNFTANIATKIQANSLPDIAMFPQPGLLSAAVQTGKVKELDATTDANVKKNFSTDWQKYVTSSGKLYATPLDASVKGYIWYSPASFKKWGVTVPTTYADLLALTTTIQQKTGQPPWCAGFNSGDASGWPGADQIAELVLANAGPSVYDDWVKGTTKFTDAKIGDAFDTLGKTLQSTQYVNAGFGDVKSINSTAFGDVATPLASGKCALTNQATFLEASFSTVKTAAGTTPTVGPDGDIWAFPQPGPTAGKNAVVGGGDFAAAFNTNAATQAVMQYLSSVDWANSLISVPNASFISANKGLDASKEKDPLLKSAIQILQDPATTFRFGADDAMPNVVETAFWTGMVDWINGKSTPAVQAQIQAAWPAG
ncbi:ABC transporter substrate-binding protein [Microbacterium candidum]|uniref:ABC transporter substrate-binding protein n=1 Tax=Microbacterium candidum TaxID=3041922 RepID=A0ABT7N4F6_9MICO|nr:ABC transporter substrate-binding protein [Microbacterium sp. ASV49]MDL9981523.1 ABC transporter substrate-binding protein [Microbacterium sp. ASV49]